MLWPISRMCFAFLNSHLWQLKWNVESALGTRNSNAEALNSDKHAGCLVLICCRQMEAWEESGPWGLWVVSKSTCKHIRYCSGHSQGAWSRVEQQGFSMICSICRILLQKKTRVASSLQVTIMLMSAGVWLYLLQLNLSLEFFITHDAVSHKLRSISVSCRYWSGIVGCDNWRRQAGQQWLQQWRSLLCHVLAMTSAGSLTY